jgi:uncharacterized protein YndB with AHSA1/START domain
VSSRLGRIEREIVIGAPPETVFAFFVDAALMARWFGVSHTLDPRPGGLFRVEVSAGNVACGTYTVVDRPHRVAFTWGWEGQATLPPGTSLVEILLEPRHPGTLLRLVHSGLSPDAASLFSPEQHGERWTHFLHRLHVAASGYGKDAGTR